MDETRAALAFCHVAFSRALARHYNVPGAMTLA